MRKRTKLLIAAACFAVALVVLALLTRNNEPKYQGRRLSDWILLYQPPISMRLPNDTTVAPGYIPHTDPDALRSHLAKVRMANTEVRHFGTNAFPYLLRWMEYDGSSRRRRADAVRRYLPAVIQCNSLVMKFLYGDSDNEDRSSCASNALRAFGSQASPTIPELARILHNTNSLPSASRAAWTLSGLGPDALPALLDVATSTSMPMFLRVSIIHQLPFHATNAPNALLALNNLREESDVELSIEADKAIRIITYLSATNAPSP